MSDLSRYSNASWHQPTSFHLSLRAIDHTATMPHELLILDLTGPGLMISFALGLIVLLDILLSAVLMVFYGLEYGRGSISRLFTIDLKLCDRFTLLLLNMWKTSQPYREDLLERAQDCLKNLLQSSRTSIERFKEGPALAPIELPAIRAPDRSDCPKRHPAPEPIELPIDGGQNRSESSRHDDVPSPIDSAENDRECLESSKQEPTPSPIDFAESERHCVESSGHDATP